MPPAYLEEPSRTPKRTKAPFPSISSTPVALRSSSVALSDRTTSNTDQVIKGEMEECSITRLTNVPLDRFVDAILNGDGQASAIKAQVARRVQDNARIKDILRAYHVSLRKEKGMSWVISLLFEEILSGLPSGFAFLPLGNTPLKGVRTLRKPDAAFVPPHVAKDFLELRDRFYATQAREDAEELDYWRSLIDNKSERASSVGTNLAGVGAEETTSPGIPTANSEEAEAVDQALLLAAWQNAGRRRQPNEDAALKASTKPSKQSDTILWSQVAVAFELKASGLSIFKNVPNNLGHDAYLTASTGSKRKVRTPGSAASSKKVRVTKNDVQLAGYMTEMCSALGHRTHTFGCLVQGKKFKIKFADAYGLIVSEEVDFTQPEGLKRMANVVAALACARRDVLGFDSRFMSPAHSTVDSGYDLPPSLTDWRYRIDENTLVTIKDMIHVQWCQTGRGTSVYLVDYEGETRVLKTSYPHSSRSREAVLLQTARQRLEARTPGAGAGVTQVYSSAQGDLVSNGFRKLLSPQYVAAHDRRLEILLVEKLEPLHSVATPEYIGPFNEILQTLLALSEDGIFHRDISTGNLMLRRLPGPEGKIQGVLSDFDLAVDIHDPVVKEVSHLHRTGTLPFLSMSLLTQLRSPRARFPYLLRFDLESCIYVFVWDAMYHPEGKNTPESQLVQTNKLLEAWLSSDPTILKRSKLDLSQTLTEYLPENGGPGSESFPYLSRCRIPLKELLASLSMGYISWDLQAAKRTLDVSSAEWTDLCGYFDYGSVLEEFKAMQVALTE